MHAAATDEARELFRRKLDGLPTALAEFARKTPEELLAQTETCELCRRDFELHPVSAGGLSFGPCVSAGSYRCWPLLPSDARPYRFCDDCEQATRFALTAAALYVRRHRSDRRRAYSEVLTIGKGLAAAATGLRPTSAGRPRGIARDFAIHVLHREGLSDGDVARVLTLVDGKPRTRRYVKDRRMRSVFRASRWMRAIPLAENFGTPQ